MNSSPKGSGGGGRPTGEPDLAVPLVEADFVVFDTELTGLDFKRDSIISVGAVRMKGSRILPGRTFYRLVRPDTELKSQGVAVHGLTHTDLEQADPVGTVLEDFRRFLGDAVLVGHFLFIDLQFVNRALERTSGRGLENPTLDTADVQAWLAERDRTSIPGEPWDTARSDLFSMARRYGILVEVERVHNALYDAYVAAQLLQRFLPHLARLGMTTVGELPGIAGY